jgi:phosphoserine phosphatase
MKYRLALFDVDSTLTETEGIDLLASESSFAREVASITEEAMHGTIDFDTALRKRVALLKDLHESVIDTAIAKTRISKGARETVEALATAGFKVGIVSGGFREIIDSVFSNWPFDLVVAHSLERSSGKLTGLITGEIVNREKKALVLQEFAESSSIQLSQTVAIGDGSNDMAMIELAGLGVAYRGKPALNNVADHRIDRLIDLLPLVLK